METLILVLGVLVLVIVPATFGGLYRAYVPSAVLPAHRKKERASLIAGIVLAVLFLLSGLLVLYLVYFPNQPLAKTLDVLRVPIFGFHLFLWMLWGMIFKYLWDLFGSGKGWGDVKVTQMAIPFFVSPVIFFTIWTLAAGKAIEFALTLVAFQNGFFWQTIFARAGPVGPGAPAPGGAPPGG
jgi:hypothetical protein